MNNEEALSILAQEMERCRATPYADLMQLLDETKYIESTAPSGTPYQVELSVVWDDKSKGDLRVIGSIDDGGWRAFKPLTDSFILRPDGTFVGE